MNNLSFQTHTIKNYLSVNDKRHVLLAVAKVGYNHLAGPLGCCFFAISPKHQDSLLTMTGSEIYKKALYLSISYVDAETVRNHTLNEQQLLSSMIQQQLLTLLKENRIDKSSLVLMESDVNLKSFSHYTLNVFHPKKEEFQSLVKRAETRGKKWLGTLMQEHHKKYPRYRFDVHLGSNHDLHTQAIEKFGYCTLHRRKLSLIDQFGSFHNSLHLVRELDTYDKNEKMLVTHAGTIYAGISNAGYEAVAGPMVATITVLNPFKENSELPLSTKGMKDDSVALLATNIKRQTLFSSTFLLENDLVSDLGKETSAQLLSYACASKLRESYPDMKILIDGHLLIPETENVKSFPKGFEQNKTISASSLYSKFVFNQVMEQADRLSRTFEFSKNKGYATEHHLLNVKKNGLSIFHRQSLLSEALETGYDTTELHLGLNEVTELVMQLQQIYNEFPSLFNEFAADLTRKNIIKVLDYNNLPSGKVQYYLYKIYKEVIRNAKRNKIDLPTKEIKVQHSKKQVYPYTYSINDMFTLKQKGIMMNEIVKLIKNNPSILSERDRQELRFLYNKIKPSILLKKEDSLALFYLHFKYLFLNGHTKTNEVISKKESKLITYDLIQKGLGVEDISKGRGMHKRTILTHVLQLIQSKYPIKPESFIEEETHSMIMNAVEKNNTRDIQQLKVDLSPTILEEEIKLALLTV